MKILQWLMAIIALVLALEVSASTVSPFHKAFNTGPVHGSHTSIADLFGSSEAGALFPGIRNARSFGDDRGRRHGPVTRFGVAAGEFGFPRNVERLKDYLSEHGYEGDVFNRDSIREWWRGRDEALTGIVTDIDVPPLGIAVSAVPVPAAIWLFGSGLAGLLVFARRRRP